MEDDTPPLGGGVRYNRPGLMRIPFCRGDPEKKPIGIKREQMGAKRVLKVSQRATKMHAKSNLQTRPLNKCQNDQRISENWFPKWSHFPSKSMNKSMRTSTPNKL